MTMHTYAGITIRATGPAASSHRGDTYTICPPVDTSTYDLFELLAAELLPIVAIYADCANEGAEAERVAERVAVAIEQQAEQLEEPTEPTHRQYDTTARFPGGAVHVTLEIAYRPEAPGRPSPQGEDDNTIG